MDPDSTCLKPSLRRILPWRRPRQRLPWRSVPRGVESRLGTNSPWGKRGWLPGGEAAISGPVGPPDLMPGFLIVISFLGEGHEPFFGGTERVAHKCTPASHE